MKRLAFIFILCFIEASTYAQDTTKTKQRLNEFGIDATGFLKQYLDFGSQQYATYYNPTYYLTYRRHFSCGNLRVAVGGDYTDTQLPPNFSTDSNKYYDRGYSFYGSIGWEFYNNLSKKWQVFYGVDFRWTQVYSKDDENYSNGGYTNGSESKTQIFSLAPLLGIRFKLTKRLSILTEASYSINREQDNNGTYYTPLPGAIPPAPQATSQKLLKVYTSFSQPLSVFIDFTI
jgi:hypothetical protein